VGPVTTFHFVGRFNDMRPAINEIIEAPDLQSARGKLLLELKSRERKGANWPLHYNPDWLKVFEKLPDGREQKIYSPPPRIKVGGASDPEVKYWTEE